MDILERLQERVPETGRPQRIVLFDRASGARHLSAVLVRLPPAHEFALHTHPISEDCFFVLSGSGEALEPARSLRIAAPAGVWIPTGQPHGLRAGAEGMLEVGFQSPPDHSAVPFQETGLGGCSPTLLTSSIPCGSPGRWAPAFPERTSWRHLDARYTVLGASERLTVGLPDFECAIVVASGEVELGAPVARRLPAFSAIRLDPGCLLELEATASPALLVSVEARVT